MSIKRLSVITQGVVMLLVAALLVAHMLQWEYVRVDAVTLALLGFLVLIPSLDLVRKIKIGDFEAEIAPREVARVVERANVELLDEEIGKLVVQRVEDDYMALVREDPRLALTKLRIDIEEVLRELARMSGVAAENSVPLRRRLDALVQAEVIPGDLAAAIRDVLPLANRAAHGEHVREADAVSLVQLGARIIDGLARTAHDRAAVPLTTEPITPEERDKYMYARYRVTTVVPLVENPRMAYRELSQDGLDAFLDTYREVAEFVVAVERVE